MTVYIVQEPMERDRATGELRSKFDFSEARQFGDLVFLLSPGMKPGDPLAITQLWEKLRGYGPGDFLLLAGNPCLLGAATAVASHLTGGRVRCLQYNGRMRGYIPVALDLRPLAA